MLLRPVVLRGAIRLSSLLWFALLTLSLTGSASPSLTNVFISELLFKPTFGDTTNEWIELRGPPNFVLPEGTYLIGVEGDENNNPGTIQNRFDLSGLRFGQNGYLVLLQKNHRYKTILYSSVTTNSDNGSGWGSGSSSSLEHEGEDDLTELENASATFLLIQSAVGPEVGDDIDANNDVYIGTNTLVNNVYMYGNLFPGATSTGMKFGDSSSKWGWWGATPVSRSTGWAITNGVTRKTIDVSTATTAQVAEMLGTLITTLLNGTGGYGLLGS